MGHNAARGDNCLKQTQHGRTTERIPASGLEIQLRELHEQLANANELVPETREALQIVAGDIQSLLAQDSADNDWSSVRQRWNEALIDFETKHPRLTEVIEEVTAVLSSAGI